MPQILHFVEGGPGTGKSTMGREIAALFESLFPGTSLLLQLKELQPTNTKAGKLFRMFTRDLLTINERAGSNPPLQRFLRIVASPEDHPIPFTYAMFATSCEHCSQIDSDVLKPFPSNHEAEDSHCPASCPHRCKHFRVLSPEDFLLDPMWYTARLFSAVNSSVNAYNWLLLKRLALSRGQAVIRWRLPLWDNTVHQLSDEEAEKFPSLWGIYVHGAPVALNYNFNTAAKLNNGTQCMYNSIYPQNPETLATCLVNASPGDVITIIPPWFSVIELDQNLMPQGMPSLSNSKILLPIPSFSKESSRKLSVKIGKDLEASTYHKGQGETFNRVILDLNPNPSWTNSLTLNGLFVGCSRPHRFQDIRILPFLNRSAALGVITNLRHDQSYISYRKQWNDVGQFLDPESKASTSSKVRRIKSDTEQPTNQTIASSVPYFPSTSSIFTSFEDTATSFDSIRVPRIHPTSTNKDAVISMNESMDTEDNSENRVRRVQQQNHPPPLPSTATS
ncbi:hypothetical protein BCR33DRAFT_783537 [Rhizoclosmatium globosum]|uniref:Uncharacterized protein n=1 Tax=Rhizoclosmatium globosum TaxID=329046 RepID=A0A1Y2CH41_9FUNG|nr:hypothetical protein BCR33DRAFT_783537 [Rhizoclosmatium globosum]|eukprot:ORY46371.1 hypothetical protein BCR33DRAFT_783537 [Rhizoclosmatium globosum]